MVQHQREEDEVDKIRWLFQPVEMKYGWPLRENHTNDAQEAIHTVNKYGTMRDDSGSSDFKVSRFRHIGGRRIRPVWIPPVKICIEAERRSTLEDETLVFVLASVNHARPISEDTGPRSQSPLQSLITTTKYERTSNLFASWPGKRNSTHLLWFQWPVFTWLRSRDIADCS